ncbi:MAG: hypothetical protein R2788_03565 [Saprospiraceae bacterium]
MHLYDKLGNLLASTMTDGNGQYYFSHSDSTDQVWISSPDSVEANTVYYIVVGTGQFSNGQLTTMAMIILSRSTAPTAAQTVLQKTAMERLPSTSATTLMVCLL